jgi:hypothetical protein
MLEADFVEIKGVDLSGLLVFEGETGAGLSTGTWIQATVHRSSSILSAVGSMTWLLRAARLLDGACAGRRYWA